MTRRRIPLLLALVAGCGGIDSYEAAAKAKLVFEEDLLDVLESVTDRKSAEAARPKLKALEKRKLELDAAIAKMGEPSEDDFMRAAELEQEGMEKLQARKNKVHERIFSDPEIIEGLGDTPIR